VKYIYIYIYYTLYIKIYIYYDIYIYISLYIYIFIYIISPTSDHFGLSGNGAFAHNVWPVSSGKCTQCSDKTNYSRGRIRDGTSGTRDLGRIGERSKQIGS